MSTEPTTEMMNEVIARFMGGVKQIIPEGGLHGYKEGTVLWMYLFSGNADPVRSLEFHTSWDWLMPVVEKIESIFDSFHGYFGVHISSNSCCIQGTKFDTRPGKEHYAYFNDVVDETKIKATHYAVYQFITWLNQQKQTNEQ